MSLQMKLIVPLLDKELKLTDFTEESGFIDVYVYDKNRPHIENCLFLVYDMSKSTKDVYEREKDLFKCTNIHNAILEHINGKFCKIYAFNIINSDIKNLYQGGTCKKYENKKRILEFWKGLDEDVCKAILSWKEGLISHDWNKKIPEYDYRPKTIGLGQNKAGL